VVLDDSGEVAGSFSGYRPARSYRTEIMNALGDINLSAALDVNE
jgi:hypothetical protein